jgi:hypothetical protein
MNAIAIALGVLHEKGDWAALTIGVGLVEQLLLECRSPVRLAVIAVTLSNC